MAKRRQAIELAEGFEEFWAIWPKKVARKEAEKAWNVLQPDETLRATIHAAVAWQKTQRSWLRDDGEYIPYPASWLRAERWKDERPRQARPERLDLDNWFEECQRLHHGRCNGSKGHRLQMAIDAQKKAAAS